MKLRTMVGIVLCCSALGNIKLAVGQIDTSDIAPVTLYNDSETPHIAKVSKIFADTALFQIRIMCQLRNLCRDVGQKRYYHPATVTYLRGSDTVSLEALARTSGKMRRDHSVCNFPPVTLRFSQGSEQDSLFMAGNRYKIFSSCQRNLKSFELYVVEEYLIYRIYNILSPYSFRSRLLSITWYDSENPGNSFTRYALMVESVQEFCQRLGITEKTTHNLADDSLQRENTTKLALFQYLIGNTDWSIHALHNIRVFNVRGNKPVAVPYDFDYSGLINAPYAEPAPELKIPSVRVRYYNGHCRTMEEIAPVIEFYNQHKKEIISLFAECPYLDERSKTKAIKYIEAFYKEINKPKTARYIFTVNCRID